MKKVNVRAVAAEILFQIVKHNGSLTSHLRGYRQLRDFPLLQEMCFGVCRQYYPLQAMVNSSLDKPLRAKDGDVNCLLLAGVYQIIFLRVPMHAAVNETVNAAMALKKPWAKGLVNALLRKCIDGPERFESLQNSADQEVAYSHPGWFIEALQSDWPEQWQQILAVNNIQAPMTLRVNLQQTQRNLYLSRLAAAGISASPGNLSESAVYLANACGVTDLPGFDSGEVSVQDEASQLVAPLLQLAPGQTVLDACAAPGGKTTHILESESLLTGVVAVDTNAERLALLKENLDRLQLQASVKQADIMHRDKWWDGTLFDRILLDAPCSATGVIRRHPDIKLLRQQSDIDAYCSRQLSLLKTLWDCLAPGGLLLYTTCSVLRCENELIIDAFLNHNPAAKYQAIAADWGVECRYGRQLLPGHSGHDGFYFARLGKDR